MKRSMIALALAACAVSGWANAADTAGSAAWADAAAGNAQTQQWSPTRNGIAPKTRAQVRQELVQAERDGQLAHLNTTLYRGGM